MANWYLDCDAVGAGNGTSWANAWAAPESVVWGASGVNAGDTLWISDGTYSGTLLIGADGTAGSRIMISVSGEAGHIGTVVFDGGGTAAQGINNPSGRNYITVYGGSLQWILKNHTTQPVHWDDSTDCILDGLYCFEIAGSHAGFHADGNTNLHIRNCKITTHNTTAVGQVDGIYSQYNTNNKYYNNWIGVYSENTDEHCDCIQLFKDAGTTIYNNYLENINSKTSNSQGVYGTECSGVLLIYNNVINGGANAMDLICLRNISTGTATFQILNNTVYGGHSAGSMMIYSDGCADPIIKNNIVHYYGTAGYAIRIDDWAGTAANVNYNCFYAPNYTYVGYCGGGKNWAAWQALGFDANGYNGDPLLSGSFAPLNASSPVVNAGADLSGYFTTDKNGTTRPVGAAWDMGAYEFKASTGGGTAMSVLATGGPILSKIRGSYKRDARR